MNLLVGFDEEGKMSTIITTPKEEIDHQFWYKGRNKVINESKHITDKYIWDDEEESELVYSYITSFKPVKSPNVYDLRTPQKKSRNISSAQ